MAVDGTGLTCSEQILPTNHPSRRDWLRTLIFFGLVFAGWWLGTILSSTAWAEETDQANQTAKTALVTPAAVRSAGQEIPRARDFIQRETPPAPSVAKTEPSSESKTATAKSAPTHEKQSTPSALSAASAEKLKPANLDSDSDTDSDTGLLSFVDSTVDNLFQGNEKSMSEPNSLPTVSLLNRVVATLPQTSAIMNLSSGTTQSEISVSSQGFEISNSVQIERPLLAQKSSSSLPTKHLSPSSKTELKKPHLGYKKLDTATESLTNQDEEKNLPTHFPAPASSSAAGTTTSHDQGNSNRQLIATTTESPVIAALGLVNSSYNSKTSNTGRDPALPLTSPD